MNQWANTVLTDKGAALLTKLTQGNTLSLTKAVTGAGFVTPALLTKQTEVTDPKHTLSFRPVTYPEAGKCAIPVALKNEGLDTGYEATQVGIFAVDPDEGEILLFISQAPDAQSGTIIPSETEMPGFSTEWTFYFQYGQADAVNVTVDPTGSVSREEMEAYIEKTFVPITNAEIDAIIGYVGNGGSSEGSGNDDGTGTSGVATLDHNLLYNRNIDNQHTISSITGLEAALNSAEGDQMASIDIETAWDTATETS